MDITDAAAALEYLRFFSSLVTWHLFEGMPLEVFVGQPGYIHGQDGADCSVCLPPQRWVELGLHSPVVFADGNAFLVTRFVVRVVKSRFALQLFRLTERVGRDGTVETMEQVPWLTLRDEEQVGLAPMWHQ
jgi:hypothetical protein